MLDFKEITDGTQFEIFIRELLIASGLRAYWSGVGPDDGRDLICIEPQNGFFEDSSKKWLISCKHNATSNKSVGIDEIGSITDLCKQHGTDGYILACSTQPSSTVITRLENIAKNENITVTYLDAVKIELMLSTPKLWKIAQKFMPISSEAKKLNVVETESPNQWVVTYDGYYFFLRNRIGSDFKYYFGSVEKIIEQIKQIKMENSDHFIRIRSVFMDDKHFCYTYYLDYMYPNSERPSISSAEIMQMMGDGYAKDDGAGYNFDVRIIPYFKHSDHFDPDHYDYYVPYDSFYKEGIGRFRTQKEREEINDAEKELILKNKQKETFAFNNLKGLFEKLDFLKLVRAENSTIESLDKFYFQEDWTKLLENINCEQDRFFSAWFLLEVNDDAKFHEFITHLPQNIENQFRLTQLYAYVPDDDNSGCILANESSVKFYEFTVYVHPYSIKNKYIGRELINNSFNSISNAIEKYLSANL